MKTLFIILSQMQVTVLVALYILPILIGLIQVYHFKADTVKRIILLILLLFIPFFGIFVINGIMWLDKRSLQTVHRK